MSRGDNLAKARRVRADLARRERKRDKSVLRAWRKWLHDEKVLYDKMCESAYGSRAHKRWVTWRRENPMPDLARVDTASKRERETATNL